MEDKCFENESINVGIAELWRGLETKLSIPLFHLYAAIWSLIGIKCSLLLLVNNKIALKKNSGIHFVTISDIEYIVSENNGSRVYYSKNKNSQWFECPHKRFSNALPEEFVQVFRSVTINKNCISFLSASAVTMDSGATLKVGRKYRPSIRELMKTFSA